MKNVLLKGKLIIPMVVFVMLATTVMSFTYWYSGVQDGTGTDNSTTITIGNGNSVATTVGLSGISSDAGTKVLVPVTQTPNAETEVTKVTFTFSVAWSWTGDIEQTGYINVECTHIMAGAVNLVDETTDGATPLFIITPTDTDIEVIGNDSAVQVSIEVEMNEPQDLEQYNKVVGQAISFTFVFSVTTAPIQG